MCLNELYYLMYFRARYQTSSYQKDIRSVNVSQIYYLFEAFCSGFVRIYQ